MVVGCLEYSAFKQAKGLPCMCCSSEQASLVLSSQVPCHWFGAVVPCEGVLLPKVKTALWLRVGWLCVHYMVAGCQLITCPSLSHLQSCYAEEYCMIVQATSDLQHGMLFVYIMYMS